MNRTARKVVFFLFLGLFLIAAPVVVLYTAGYRINPGRLALVKTGVFAISSEPKSATIIIDGVSTSQKTNAVLKNIMPGEHTVRLEKGGYFPWEKKLEVKENETTFVQKTVLFLTGEPALNVPGNYLAFVFSRSGKNIAFALTEGSWVEIWSRTLSSGEEKLLSRLSNNGLGNLTLSWSFDDSLLFVKETNGTAETWLTIDQNGNSQKTEKPLAEWSRDVNQFLFVKNNNLIRRDANGLEQTLASLPSGTYEFLPAPPTTVLLQDKTRNKIILIDDRGVDQPILLNTDAFVAVWNPQNEKQLLYASDFEIHLFDAEKLSDELITRVSVPIIGAAWQPTGADIFYADNNNLYAMELDRRGSGYQIFNLATMTAIQAITIAPDGQNAFLVGTNGTDVGLFIRALQK